MRLHPAPDPGDTLLLDGVPVVVLCRLARTTAGHSTATRVTPDLPCSCGAALAYEAALSCWRCSGCRTIYKRRAALAELCRAAGGGGTESTHPRHVGPPPKRPARRDRAQACATGARCSGPIGAAVGRIAGPPPTRTDRL